MVNMRFDWGANETRRERSEAEKLKKAAKIFIYGTRYTQYGYSLDIRRGAAPSSQELDFCVAAAFVISRRYSIFFVYEDSFQNVTTYVSLVLFGDGVQVTVCKTKRFS